MCEDYRAGLVIERDDDAADLSSGRNVTSPMLLMESAYDVLDIHGSPAAIWAPWLSGPLRHRIIDCGHHQAEEAPGPVADALLDFLGANE
jgi:haloacetate dehalogenase